MRKSLLYALAAIAAISAFSCTKEIEVKVEEQNVTKETFTYTFRVDSESDGSTKTTLDGTTIKWEANDHIGVFAEGSVNKDGKITTLDPVSFPVELDAALAVGKKVYCYFPLSAANNETTAHALTLNIPTAQTGNFDAMPQVSIPYTVTEALEAGSNPVADIKFCNLGAVARFLVYSSTGAYTSEKVSSITFTASGNIAGNFTFAADDVDYEDQSTLEISCSENTVRLVTSPTIAATKAEAGTANMIIAPNNSTGYTGTVVLVTDKAKYTFPVSSAIKFPRSGIKQIGLNLESANCTRTPVLSSGDIYVPAGNSISVGDQILIVSGTSGNVKVMGYQKTNNRDAVSYTITDGSITTSNTMYPLTVGQGINNTSYFTLYDLAYDGFLYAAASGSNNMKTQSSVNVNAEWQIELDENSKATTLKATASSNRNVMRYNSSSTLFSCYAAASASDYEDIYIFKKSTATVVSAANVNIAYGAGKVNVPYSIYNPSGATTAVFNTNPGSCGSNIEVDEENHKVTFDITQNPSDESRTVKIDITNNGVTKTVSIVQAAAPTKLTMTSITATPSENHIVFTWTTVSGATGYAISTNGGSTYGDPQTELSYDWTSLSPATSYTIYIKAIGDGDINYSDSDPVSKSATTLAPSLALPTGLSWDKEHLTLSWTDTNTGAGTYGTDYKYVYSTDNGVSTHDATTSTTAVLTITETTSVKVKAVALTAAHQNSAFTDAKSCVVGSEFAGIPVSWPIVNQTAPTISSNVFSATPTSVGTATLQICNGDGEKQTMTTTTSNNATGVYNSSFEEGWYWLFAIPVENLTASTNIKLQAGLYNNDSQTYTIYYSTNNSTWTSTGVTISQTSKKSAAVKNATFTTTAIAEGTLYIKLVAGTTCSSRLVKEIGFTIVTPAQ